MKSWVDCVGLAIGMIGVLVLVQLCFESAHDARVQTCKRMAIVVQSNSVYECEDGITPCEFLKEKKR